MIEAELVSVNSLKPLFHIGAQQITGSSPAEVVQASRRKPRGDEAHLLAYLRAFMNPALDPCDNRPVLGMLHIGMLCAGGDLDVSEVIGWPHGLRCVQSPVSRNGILGVVMAGDGEVWAAAIKNAPTGPDNVRMWGLKCYQQFAKYNLEDLIGRIRQKGDNYLIE